MSQEETCKGPTRSELRCGQVLDAAAECFKQSGFHGTSMARISEAAGMSVGHIYHFFSGKEAIIEALVARKTEHTLEIFKTFEEEEDIFQGLLNRVDTGLGECTDCDLVPLDLEVVAEAARNPDIAKIVQGASAKVSERMTHVLRMLHQSRGQEPALCPEATTQVLKALFEGMGQRIVQNPDMDRKEVAKAMRVAIRALLEA